MTRPPSRRTSTRKIRETIRWGAPGSWVHPEWESMFPWLAQGITGGSSPGIRNGTDFGVFTPRPPPDVHGSWEGLCAGLGFDTVLHSRQVHAGKVLVHGADLKVSLPKNPPVAGEAEEESDTESRSGLGATLVCVGPDADGHVTRVRGLLLGVTVADCVPVFLLRPERRVLGLLHAGWRGVVAGILEAGLEAVKQESAGVPDDIHLHLGPSICGSCYEVGPEVHRALGLPDPGGPEAVDLGAELVRRAVRAGVSASRITRSLWCTLCGDSPFYSHRRGDPERQVAFLGFREDGKPWKSEVISG